MKLDTFPIRRIHKRVDNWWHEPSLLRARPHISTRMRNLSPDEVAEMPHREKTAATGRFLVPKRWESFSKIGGMDVGYIVPVYSLKEIALRYGLSQNTQRYWKKYILPLHIEIVRRRSVTAHHWSRFMLTALDVVLLDLYNKGYFQFTRNMEEHIELLREGTEYLQRYYEDEHELRIDVIHNKYGVHWN